MLKTFGKVFMISLIVVAMTAPLAFATTARVNTLAQSGDYINDDSNVFRWYATLPSYSNLVMAEVGTYEPYFGSNMVYHQGLGVTHACGENGQYGTFGVFLLDNITDDSFFMVNPLVTPGLWDDVNNDYVSVPVNKFAIGWGKEFEGLAVGLMFTRSDVGMEDNQTDPVDKSHISFTTFGGGIRADLGEDAYTDIAVTMGFASGGITDSTEFDKKNAFNIAGRIFWEWKDYATLVPLIEFGMYEYALSGDQNRPHGDKGSSILIGTAMNLDVNTNNLLIFGVEFEYMKSEPSFPDTSATSIKDMSIMVLPTFRLALESDIKPWLTTRVGALKSLWKYTDTSVDGKEYFDTGAEFNWFLGCGFHVAEFDIDCELDSALPFSLGYWLTGHSAYDSYEDYNSGPITRISATYHF